MLLLLIDGKSKVQQRRSIHCSSNAWHNMYAIGSEVSISSFFQYLEYASGSIPKDQWMLFRCCWKFYTWYIQFWVTVFSLQLWKIFFKSKQLIEATLTDKAGKWYKHMPDCVSAVCSWCHQTTCKWEALGFKGILINPQKAQIWHNKTKYQFDKINIWN